MESAQTICQACQTPNPVGANFCRKCGTMLSRTAPVRRPAGPAQPAGAPVDKATVSASVGKATSTTPPAPDLPAFPAVRAPDERPGTQDQPRVDAVRGAHGTAPTVPKPESPLEFAMAAAGADPGRSGTWRRVLLVACVVVGLAIVAWSLLRPKAASDATPAAPAATSPTAAPSTTPSAASSATFASPQGPAAPATPVVTPAQPATPPAAPPVTPVVPAAPVLPRAASTPVATPSAGSAAASSAASAPRSTRVQVPTPPPRAQAQGAAPGNPVAASPSPQARPPAAPSVAPTGPAPAVPSAPAPAAAAAIPSTAPDPAPARPAAAPAAPTPLPTESNAPVAAEPSSPDEACGRRVLVARARCMETQCANARFRNHPQCVQMRESQQRTSNF